MPPLSARAAPGQRGAPGWRVAPGSAAPRRPGRREAALEAIVAELAAGGEVSITGFGRFSVAERGPRRARNPQAGAPIELPAGRAPRLAAGAKLRQAVAG
jgi:DNA-binding protein HU-beta